MVRIIHLCNCFDHFYLMNNEMTQRSNPMTQILFVLSLAFSLVYLGLGIVLIVKKEFIPGLNYTLQFIFGVGCIGYSALRFYRAFQILKKPRQI